MNKRQRKKMARINNYWTKTKKINSYDCQCCSWCALNDDGMKYHKVLRKHKDYWGVIEWVFEVRCPYCGTIFEYCDSSM